MPGCAVANCTTYNRKTKGTDVIYHCFPKDVSVQKLWIHRCKRKDSFNVSTATVCSQHFTNDDYMRDLKSELLGLTCRKRLKPDAVPTLNLPTSNSTNITSVSCSASIDISENDTQMPVAEGRALRCNNRSVRKRALETVANISPKKRNLVSPMGTDQETQCMLSDIKEMERRMKELELENRRLNKVCIQLRARNKCLNSQLVATGRNSQKYLPNIGNKVESEVRQILEKLFTRNQVRCLMKGKKYVKWDREDICRAIILRAVSRRCYIFLREKMGFPLPGISTLKRWAARSFHCHPGILHDVLQLMKTQAERLNNLERICIISFDEMNVDSRITYDQEEDRIVGPHSNVQVAMIRGLFASWKQPIYFDFDTQMTAPLLKKIISSLEDVHYNVVAAVADLGGKNRAVWNELQVTHTNTCFPNPRNPKKRVWVFADVPHLYKLLRNHFLDDGLTLPGNKKIGKATIEQLLTSDCKEMKICPKLSLHHISVKGRDRQRVYLATQLFSNHTAQGIRFLMPQEEHVAKFIQLLNDSFDILNSRRPTDEKLLSCGFGIHRETQERILRQLHACIRGMKVGKATHLLPFQKGFITTIRSLLGLFTDLKPLNIKYILTARLNQDCLENFFSRIRGLGHFYDHPLPTEVKFRIRLLLLGANVNDIPLSNSSPVVSSDYNDDDKFMTSQLFGTILPDVSEPLAMIEGKTEIRDITLPDSEVIQDPLVIPSGPDLSVEGFRYLAGYIAYRGRKYDYSLGTPTGQLLNPPSVTEPGPVGWIETLSRGGLLVPSDAWLEKVSQFELMFIAVHGCESLSRENNIVHKLCVKIGQRFPDVPAEVVKLYVRTRTFLRLRNLNKKAKIKKAEEAQQRKARKWKASSK